MLQTNRLTTYSEAVLYPPPVAPGDTLRIVAPSGPFDKTLFYRALGWLAERYHLIWSRGALERRGYLAGSDDRRLAELNEALCDPTARAIVAVRGGYGLTRICHAASVRELLRYPKWCVGFSDFSALHLEAMQAGVASLHASNLAALGRADEVARREWLDALERPLARRTFPGLEPLCTGQCRGVLVGGNLTLLFTAAASGRLRLPEGCILFFEEVNEAPYRIDRMLTALRTSGQLAKVAGFCAGDLVDDGKPAARRAAAATLLDCLGGLGVPLVLGLPVGHGRVNAPLPLGVPARLDADLGVLVIDPHEASDPRDRPELSA
jgi:muramoyltetrapeptide carboxypeptidase